MANVVDEYEKWRTEGEQMRQRLVDRRDALVEQIDRLKDELTQVNQALMKVGVDAVRTKTRRRKGQGSVQPNRGGWRWRVFRGGKVYQGPTVPDRDVAEAELDAALAALDRGEEPDVARKPAPAEADEPDPETMRRTTPVAAPPKDEPLPVPVSIPRPAPKPRAPDPDRIKLIADRVGSATRAASDLAAITRGIGKLPSRLANVARRHWLRGQTPALIAREIGVREDAVVNMLVEARELAIAPEAA